ncbi:MAG: NFACT RNA binding domain-containing protein [Longimicrobiales bacterium]
MRQERAAREPNYRTIEEMDGCEILVGKAAVDNDLLTFRVARPNDWWLHAAGYAGSHVVVRAVHGSDVPRHVLERAAQLAAFHSKAREARGKIAVHLCRAGDVRKRRGAAAGQVELTRYDTLKVYPRE